MSNPYFETWERENLVKFCQEAYDKLQRQDEELQELRWAQQEKSSLADALYERMKEERQINEALRGDPGNRYAHRLAIELECALLAPEQANAGLLDEYHTAVREWMEANGQPYVSGFGKD
jgi:uncharacterized protein with von Willebrand factor type A (vWA) domain